jgi:hypothetical protein
LTNVKLRIENSSAEFVEGAQKYIKDGLIELVKREDSRLLKLLK